MWREVTALESPSNKTSSSASLVTILRGTETEAFQKTADFPLLESGLSVC